MSYTNTNINKYNNFDSEQKEFVLNLLLSGIEANEYELYKSGIYVLYKIISQLRIEGYYIKSRSFKINDLWYHSYFIDKSEKQETLF